MWRKSALSSISLTRTFSFSTARRVDSSSNSLESSLPTVFSATLPSYSGRSGFTDSRTLCALPCNFKPWTPTLDGQWSTPPCIGKSADDRWRFTHLSKLRTSMCDVTYRPPLRLCGTRRNSGLRCSSVLPSTSKTPKCRIPTPRDLMPPVPPRIDGPD